MTILEELVTRPKPPAWATLIAKHQQSSDTRIRMGDWGRKGGSHFKDNEFAKK